jgi:hypothetical protein
MVSAVFSAVNPAIPVIAVVMFTPAIFDVRAADNLFTADTVSGCRSDGCDRSDRENCECEFTKHFILHVCEVPCTME